MILFENIVKQKYYYNTYGRFTPLIEILKIEIDERGNYTWDQAKEWMKKYNLKDDSPAVWVTLNKKDLRRYLVDEGEVNRIERSAGFLITESNDGDGGYIFIQTNKNSQFEIE